MAWETTWLHKVEEYGGSQDMGSGSFGATVWNSTARVSQPWATTWLHQIETYGGQEEMGSGSYGKTIWETQ